MHGCSPAVKLPWRAVLPPRAYEERLHYGGKHWIGVRPALLSVGSLHGPLLSPDREQRDEHPGGLAFLLYIRHNQPEAERLGEQLEQADSQLQPEMRRLWSNSGTSPPDRHLIITEQRRVKRQ